MERHIAISTDIVVTYNCPCLLMGLMSRVLCVNHGGMNVHPFSVP